MKTLKTISLIIGKETIIFEIRRHNLRMADLHQSAFKAVQRKAMGKLEIRKGNGFRFI